MLQLKSSLQTIHAGGKELHLFIPDPESVRRYYQKNAVDFPYWSQIWPAAIGLCEFLSRHTAFIRGKTVLELAAGLGLPSLFAAQYASSVLMSDYLPETVELLQQTIHHQQQKNLSAQVLNWNNIPSGIKADVLLLSDVNYEPGLFDTVYSAITRFLKEGTTIILSTPQRLMAKPFVEKLLSFSQQHEEIMIQTNGKTVVVSVLILKS